ncbi:MAG: serine acetyltransferase [Muribaculaceae bacterium]|nr:serine acetyltransferase [Muribaculaceae bacterium]
MRTGANWLRNFAKGQTNLEFYTPSDRIGKGLIIWHGFSTVINVREMGENCQVWQNVTIGKKSSTDYDDRPIIGAGTKICAGAIVAGEINIAPEVTVGAGAVVVKDVPEPGTVVVSGPSRYIIR